MSEQPRLISKNNKNQPKLISKTGVKKSPTRKKFEQFHSDNPHVYKRFEEMAWKLKAAGINRYSIRTLAEVIRWESTMKTTSDDFKLNNNYVPYYGRLIMATNPNLQGMFELREHKADQA